MSFFSKPITGKIRNPLDSLPTKLKECPEEGNATLTVREVRAQPSKTSDWQGIIWSCEIQIDGEPSPLSGGQNNGTAGVDLLLTVQSADGSPLLSTGVYRAARKLSDRMGEAYKAAGHPLAENPDGFVLPDGLDLNSADLGPALKSIEGRPIRGKCWVYKGKSGRGVDFVALFPED